jgi:16S rRNA (adenine1518-N6/adenine1519-N6)-dimethyltransferase
VNLTDINEIKALLARHGFRFSKSMGQNFLCAGWVPERIAEEALLDERTGVLEIGPGIGCLTRELAQYAGKVVSVELDESLKPVLAETLTGCENVQVVFGDVLKKDLPALLDEEFADFEKLAVCANLPYNITSPVLTALVECERFESITVMIQREVARRICARENTADYGAFTVLMQWHCRTEMLFDVPPSCFIPAPKVTSTVIRLERRESAPFETADEKLMFAIVRASFNQRRKTLSNALSNGLGGRFDKERIAVALKKCGLDERIRGEALSIGQFAALAGALAEGER